MMPSNFNVKVVGITFVEDYPHNIHRLLELDKGRQPGDEMMTAVLVRNPANEYDANAIEVHIPALGPDPEGMIGHVPKEIAARLAPEMDAAERGETNRRWMAGVAGIRQWPNIPDQPGITIKIEARDQE